MKILLLFLFAFLIVQTNAQTKHLDSVRTDNWKIKDYITPNMIFETIVYEDSISVKLIKGNSKAMDKLVGTPKFTKVFYGKVESTETEFLLKTNEYRITVTRGGTTTYTTVEEKDSFTGEITTNIYFGKKPK